MAAFTITDTAELQRAREAVDEVLQQAGIEDIHRQRTILCISEAVTNMLLHGGGHGEMAVRRLTDRLRFVVADEGAGPAVPQLDRAAVDGRSGLHGLRLQDHPGTTWTPSRCIPDPRA